MRVDPLRVYSTPEIRRPDDPSGAVRRAAPRTPVADTSDLIAISSGVSLARSREVTVEGLRQAYLSGAIRPDAGRIADKLLDWGFDPGAV